MNIRYLFISPGHNFYGRHGQSAGSHPMQAMEAVECLAGRGLRGDRFLDYKPDYKGQITFFDWANLMLLWTELEIPEADRDPSATRRNVLVEGLDLNALIGREFTLQGIRFLGTEESRPCSWMNGALHPGAEVWLKGRGGLRAKILNDGVLRRGID